MIDEDGNNVEIIRSSKNWVAFEYTTANGGYIMQPHPYNPFFKWIKVRSYGPGSTHKTLTDLLKALDYDK